VSGFLHGPLEPGKQPVHPPAGPGDGVGEGGGGVGFGVGVGGEGPGPGPVHGRVPWGQLPLSLSKHAFVSGF
jgi:hypothetical protein